MWFRLTLEDILRADVVKWRMRGSSIDVFRKSVDEVRRV